jgi:hypothetical protein
LYHTAPLLCNSLFPKLKKYIFAAAKGLGQNALAPKAASKQTLYDIARHITRENSKMKKYFQFIFLKRKEKKVDLLTSQVL